MTGTVYASRTVLTAAAALTPDSPILPAETPSARRWRGPAGPEFEQQPNGRLVILDRFGQPASSPWHPAEANRRFGPLTEVTPFTGPEGTRP